MAYKRNLIYLTLLLILSLCTISCDSYTQERNRPIVSFTLDDGHLDAYENGFPLFNKFGYEVTTFLNSGRIGNSGYVTWEQVHNLYNNNWEIGGHTVSHVDLMELNDDEAYYEIMQDYQNFLAQGIKMESFALPGGHASERDYDIIKSIYKNIRNSIDKEIHIPINRLDLGYLAYQTEYNPETVSNRILRAGSNGEVLIVIGFHKIGDDQTSPTPNCRTQDLDEILNWVTDKGFEVMRLDKAINKILNQ